MILVVNFNLVENALLEKVSTELGFSERCQYIQEPVTNPKALGDAFDRTGNELPRWVLVFWKKRTSLKISINWAARRAFANRMAMKAYRTSPKPRWAIGSMFRFCRVIS